MFEMKTIYHAPDEIKSWKETVFLAGTIDMGASENWQEKLAINKSGHWTDVYKEPKTDPGKNSKKGVLSVMDNFVTIRAEDIYLTNKYLGQTDQLGLIFDNGDLIVDETFDTIRERAKVV
jgi:nicotinic acid phosphoribosyltransferase